MKVSVVIPHACRDSAAAIAAVARHVEDVGLDGVFVGDHLAGAVPIADSTVVLATAAAASERIRVGYGVMVLALRHPAWAAKQLATLQHISGGRVILGVGLGGSVHGRAAWDAVGVPYGERAARTDAALAVLRGLVRGEAVTLAGGTRLELAPGAEPPPIWIGGMGEAARRRAVLHGDAWFPSMLGPDEVAAGAAQLAAAAEAHGRDRAPAIAAGGAVLLGDPVDRAALDAHVASLVDGYGLPPDVAGRVPLTGPPARVAERLAAYAQVGPSHMVLGLIGEDWRAQCELLAEAVRLVPDGRAEAPPGQAARPARAVRPAGAA